MSEESARSKLIKGVNEPQNFIFKKRQLTPLFWSLNASHVVKFTLACLAMILPSYKAWVQSHRSSLRQVSTVFPDNFSFYVGEVLDVKLGVFHVKRGLAEIDMAGIQSTTLVRQTRIELSTVKTA